MPGRSSLRVVEHLEQQDMRQVCWGYGFLHGTMKEYNLKHGQAVAYRNRKETRWRMVMCLHGMPVLVIPPVEREHRLSLDLSISQFVRQLNASGGTLAFVDRQIHNTATRLQQRQKLAAAAKSGRVNHGKANTTAGEKRKRAT